jgi:hypothetical protein
MEDRSLDTTRKTQCTVCASEKPRSVSSSLGGRGSSRRQADAIGFGLEYSLTAGEMLVEV